MTNGLLLLIALGTGWGCAAVSPPIAIEARPADMADLVGQWAGEYEGQGMRGRAGSILFTLAAGEDHAHGDVLMTPAGAARGYDRAPLREPFERWNDVTAQKEMLTIHFVRLSGRKVSGALDPYWDPDRECWATTTFVGTLVEHTITGTFRTTFSSVAHDVKGRWQVRKAPAR